MENSQLAQANQFHWPIRIYYEDTDAGGIVYYANYLKYFERARTEWLRQHGVSQQKLSDQQQMMFVVRSAQIDYYLPAKLDDELVITTEIEKLGRASLVFMQKLWRADVCLVSGRFKVGCVHSKMIRPCAIPSFVIEAVNNVATSFRGSKPESSDVKFPTQLFFST